MALDLSNIKKYKRGKVLRIRLKEDQYKLFLEYCRTQNTTPVRFLKKEIKLILEEFANLKDDGMIPQDNQLVLFDNEEPVRPISDCESAIEEKAQLELF